MTGHLFGDRYQVGDTLGFGGMSEVHRGRDLRLGRDVAIKVLRADLARDPSFQTRFRREAQNAASLNHPAIVAVYDTGETQGETGTIPYIVMEYVDGETLRDLLKREGSLAPKRAMEIVADVCAALDFSHRHGIVHRDIKPANVMLTRAGAVKVMDFGIARAVADGQATMTATAAVIGTAQYLSPEQARGEAVDARSDVYATGCVLFELLVGAPPFTGDSPVAVAYQHVREEPKAPSEVKPGLPKELDSIVLKALNKNPLNRYQTAAEMRSDLVRALSGQAVHATPVMSDDERTQLMRATPERVGLAVAAGPSLLAPPRRLMTDDVWEEDEPDRSKKVWGYVGIGVLCIALLVGAIFLTRQLTSVPPTPASVSVPQVQGLTKSAAEKAITNAGLILGAETPLPSDSVPSG
jgi:serine/threonine protein kinase